jgi:pentatricopeptide repeat domain-containing protein 1
MAPGTVQLSIFSWNAILAKYVKAGQYEKTMGLFHQLQQKGIVLNRSSFPVLKACASLFALEEGKKIHSQVVESGCESDVYVGSTLVHMYAKCGSIEDARNVFDRMPKRDVVTWNAMIRGYAKCGQGWEALKLFRQMQDEGVQPDSVIFMGLLNACASVAAFDEGKYVHKQIIAGGLEGDVFLGSSLVDMYAKCGSIKDAWNVFNKMHTHDVLAWSAMILG